MFKKTCEIKGCEKKSKKKEMVQSIRMKLSGESVSYHYHCESCWKANKEKLEDEGHTRFNL